MRAYYRRNRLQYLKIENIIFFLILLFLPLLLAPENVSATSHCNIDDTYHTAWSETIGWIDFKPDAVNCAIVEDTKLTGWVWSDFAGWISLNCETDGSECSAPYGVVNDGNGNLSGVAWSESLGWLDFAPPPGSERVIITANGEFVGYAWGENFGWISFNCDQSSQGGGNSCPPAPGGVDYKVKTSWVPNAPPNKPVNIAPPDATPLETVIGITPILNASPFSDPNPGNTHQATEWELSIDQTQDVVTGNFTNAPILIPDSDANKIEHQITGGMLAYGTRYYWHVRYHDNTNLWSLWSDVWSFTTPLSQPQNVVGYPDDDPQNPSGETEYPFTITWKWDPVFKDGGTNPASFVLYLDDMSNSDDCDPLTSGQQDYCTSADYWTNITSITISKDYNGIPLSSNAQYKAIVFARDPVGNYANSLLSTSSDPVYLAVTCVNGIECRKGEVCVDHDGNAGNSKICANFDNCANGQTGALATGNSCYISACNQGVDCYSSPAGRDFTVEQGQCVAAKTCDLPAIKPHAPEVCKNDGSDCQNNSAPVTNAPYLPIMKWINGDPAEVFTDYRVQPISYSGESMQYKVLVTGSTPYTFDATNASPDLALGMAPDRSLNLSTVNGGQNYLDFNSSYTWQVTVKNAAGADQKISDPWQFTTTSICPYVIHDYAPPMYKDETVYPSPNNIPDNPNVMYPLDATLKWSFDSSLPDGAIKGPGVGNKPTFKIYVQESDNGTLWTPAFPAQDVGVATEFRFGGTSPNCADDPGTCLKPDKYYKWYLEVNHGHNPGTPINTLCNTDNPEKNADVHYFISETTPAITLSKKLISIRGSELTYQIDFSFTGAPWSRIKNFQVRDNYPDSVKTDFFDTKNSIVTDDTLKTKEPNTLKITRLCEAQSGSNKTALIWGIGDGADQNCANVNANCAVSTNCSVSVKSRGSFTLVINEQTEEPIPQCTLLANQSTAKGQALNGTVLSVASNSVSHLAGSGENDAGFLVTGRGDIHSNADICFKNFPDAGKGFYVGDYFVTAKGVIDSPNPRSGAQYVFSDNPILELDRNPSAPDFAKIDYTNVYALAKNDGNEHRGECSASQIFGSENAMPVIQLNGNVYSCRSGEAGATDYNGDGNSSNGDFVVDREMEIKTDGGSGTIVIDGNLYINADIFYRSGAPSSIKSIAALGWIVRGSVYITGYRIDEVTDCTALSADPRPKKWCDAYQALESLDNGPDGLPNTEDDIYALKYPAITLGPNQISGTFFSEQKIFTGKINNPLTINGSLIADEVVLERRAVDDSGGSAPLPTGGVIDANNRFAYGELVGWIDMKPVGGGVYVYNNRLDGFAYSELTGWISMKPLGGGVMNNGSGALSGYAYSDIGGWIRFDPSLGGVIINPSTGEFSGNAYGELVGWIRFKGNGYGVVTTWRGQ